MGRVSKHKKTKSCDPFYKGPRRTHVRKGDFPPSNDEEQLPPKALLRLFKPARKPKKNGESKVDGEINLRKPEATVKDTRKRQNRKHDPSTTVIEKERENDGCLREEGSLKGRSAMFVRRPGETTRAYLERIDMESQMRISESLRKGRNSERRKRYWKGKSERKLVIREEDIFKDFGDLKDEVRFGEVIKAPPKLDAKPRGSQFIKKTEGNGSLRLLSSSLCQPMHVVGLKHEQDMQDERLRVISAYRLVKKLKTDKR